MGGIPIPPHAEVVATALVVEVIVETAQLAILKSNAGETGAAWHRRCHDLHDDSDSPLLITYVRNFIPDTEEKSLFFTERLRRFGSMAMILRDEIDGCDWRFCDHLTSCFLRLARFGRTSNFRFRVATLAVCITAFHGKSFMYQLQLPSSPGSLQYPRQLQANSYAIYSLNAGRPSTANEDL